MCPTLKSTFSTQVISHWTRRQMRSPHWFEALSLLHAPGSWSGALAEAATLRRARRPGKYAHRVITGGVGHNLPQEAPQAFAKAVVEVDGY
jgi:pimeloyl-ACP methyl ester carboxylesterase